VVVKVLFAGEREPKIKFGKNENEKKYFLKK